MTKKTLFLLKGVFHDTIDHKYQFTNHENNISLNTQERTHISDLSIKNDNDKISFSFLDEAKKDHNYILTMFDMIGKPLENTSNLYCFWCRHPFTTIPIGCPIYYNPQRIMKNMISDTLKDPCILRENISSKTYDRIKTSLLLIPITDTDFYIVDGIFCSFPCCLAFIRDQKYKNPLYQQSEYLLQQMYQKIFKDQSTIIHCAPSWRLLQCFGGHLSITDFRKCFENTHYIDTNQIIYDLPHMKQVGFLFEKQITL